MWYSLRARKGLSNYVAQDPLTRAGVSISVAFSQDPVTRDDRSPAGISTLSSFLFGTKLQQETITGHVQSSCSTSCADGENGRRDRVSRWRAPSRLRDEVPASDDVKKGNHGDHGQTGRVRSTWNASVPQVVSLHHAPSRSKYCGVEGFVLPHLGSDMSCSALRVRKWHNLAPP